MEIAADLCYPVLMSQPMFSFGLAYFFLSFTMGFASIVFSLIVFRYSRSRELLCFIFPIEDIAVMAMQIILSLTIVYGAALPFFRFLTTRIKTGKVNKYNLLITGLSLILMPGFILRDFFMEPRRSSATLSRAGSTPCPGSISSGTSCTPSH